MISLPLLLIGMVNHITHRTSSLYGCAEGYNREGLKFGSCILSMGGILCSNYSMFESPAGGHWFLLFFGI